ncbi:hypothetical protein CTI14_42740, partial [Methylobacterium radiotolerans]
MPWTAYGLYGAAIMAALWYFFYVDRNLLVRVYVLNAGFGLLFCYAAWRLRRASRQRPIDKALFLVVLLFGLHFVPRTLLSMGRLAPQGALAFAAGRAWTRTRSRALDRVWPLWRGDHGRALVLLLR